VQEAWGRPGFPGARAVAGPDEDALTLGLQAAWQAQERLSEIEGLDPDTVDGLIFASTTSVFTEKSSATMLAGALGLPDEARCLDLGASLRAGSTALETAVDLVAAGSCRHVLVIAADTRNTAPGSGDEFLFGHAGVALVVGRAEDAAAQIVAHTRHTSTQYDTWRTAEARFPSAGDVRFARQGAYAAPVKAALATILEQTGWSAGDIDLVVPYSPDVKSASRILAKSGFDLKRQYCDLVSSRLGLTGAAHTLLMLGAALERARKGQRLLVLGYGDGATACALQMTDDVNSARYKTALKQGYDISYTRFLAAHDLLASDADSGGTGVESRSRGGFSSEIMETRNGPLWFSLAAKRCSACGAVVALPLPACPHCPEPTQLEYHTLAKTGTVFAVTHEHYYPTPEPPLGMATVNLDSGGRLTVQVADENTPLQVGDPVELVLRRLHDAGGRPNYFWKCRALTGGQQQHDGQGGRKNDQEKRNAG